MQRNVKLCYRRVSWTQWKGFLVTFRGPPIQGSRSLNAEETREERVV